MNYALWTMHYELCTTHYLVIPFLKKRGHTPNVGRYGEGGAQIAQIWILTSNLLTDRLFRRFGTAMTFPQLAKPPERPCETGRTARRNAANEHVRWSKWWPRSARTAPYSSAEYTVLSSGLQRIPSGNPPDSPNALVKIIQRRHHIIIFFRISLLASLLLISTASLPNKHGLFVDKQGLFKI